MAVSSLKNKSKLSTLTSPFDIDLGGMIPLATVAVTSNTATITFSDIPNYYEHLQIRCTARSNRSGQPSSFLNMRFNDDSNANYTWHTLNANGSSAGSSGQTGNTAAIVQRIAAADATSGIFGVFVMDILDYGNTNKYKTVRNLGGNDRNGAGQIFFDSNLWLSTSAINKITFTSEESASFIANSNFALYGIKRAGA